MSIAHRRDVDAADRSARYAVLATPVMYLAISLSGEMYPDERRMRVPRNPKELDDEGRAEKIMLFPCASLGLYRSLCIVHLLRIFRQLTSSCWSVPRPLFGRTVWKDRGWRYVILCSCCERCSSKSTKDPQELLAAAYSSAIVHRCTFSWFVDRFWFAASTRQTTEARLLILLQDALLLPTPPSKNQALSSEDSRDRKSFKFGDIPSRRKKTSTKRAERERRCA